MLKTIYAGLIYFALVLGVFRVPYLVPRIGERWAELAEMPIMAAAIYISAGYVLRRFPEINFPGQSLLVGVLTLALMLCAELGLSVALQSQSLTEYIISRDKISGSVYLVMLVLFALMPMIRLSNPKA